MSIFSALLYVLCDVIIKIFIDAVSIDFNTSVIPTYVAFIADGIIKGTVISALAVIFTRDLRNSSIMHFPANIKRFYTIYFIIYSIAAVFYSVYINIYSKPFYTESLDEAYNSIYIRKYTTEHYNELCRQLKDVCDSLQFHQKIAQIVGCALHIAILGVFLIKILRVYKDPYKPPKRRI